MIRKSWALILVFAIMWAFTACGEDEADILADFYQILEGPASSDNAVAASLFLDDKIDEVDKSTAEEMVAKYQDYLYDYILAQKDKTRIQEMAVYFDKETGFIDEEKIKASSHGEYHEKLKIAGLKLYLCSEEPSLKIDYGNFLDRFQDYLPESMVNFLQLEQLITENPATVNANLVISWEDLLNRAFRAEQIITNFPQAETIKQDVQWLYKNYLGMILMGTTNSPVFDYNSKDFSKEALASYRNFIQEEPDTVLTWVLVKYIEYLQDIEFQMDFNDASMGKAFFDNCDWIISEGEKRLNQQ